ncbi:MAG: uracil phosphoribosyltransferase [Verrucomicrobiales bacterium]
MLRIVDHPVIRERLTRLRAADTETSVFRHALHDISRLMCFEVTRDFETKPVEVETPLATTDGHRLVRPVVLVPVLRAGLGMLHGFSEILTEASVGCIGLRRDEESLEARGYYRNLPKHLPEADVILVDPMLATGNSGAEAADQLKQAGARRIRFACLVASPEGVESFGRRHPGIEVYAAALDERLDERSFIVPGLGDAGDRYFGT